jgi:predicted GTPase
MKRQQWRLILLAFLAGVPVLFLIGCGFYQLWVSGVGFWVWWPMTACLTLAYLLAWRWLRARQILYVEPEIPLHWTDRDKEAWHLVEARAKAAAKIPPDKLSEIGYYVSTAQEMALELARFYHPHVDDPMSALTIPEMLAVVELAAHDLADIVNRYLPAGHLLTVQDWKRARQVSDWYQRASNLYWLIGSIINPVQTGLRYAASQVGVSRPLQLVQENLILWFYTAYVNRLGTYLIDLNSGRLRVGAERYRELMKEAQPLTPQDGQQQLPDDAAPDGEPTVPKVTITVLGQVKAGKSSLINALLGEQKAKTDVLPATTGITRYALALPGGEARLELLDTVGYGHSGPRQDQLRSTEEAARESDLLILVVHACNPARQADMEMLQKLKEWFEARPDLKMPPVLGVMTHIDLLSPTQEWKPPYNWQEPQTTKEHRISGALGAAQEQLGTHLAAVVPVRADAGKVYGIEEAVLPAVTQLVGHAQAVAMLRCLHNEVDARKVRRVFDQLFAAGKQFVRILLDTPRR